MNGERGRVDEEGEGETMGEGYDRNTNRSAWRGRKLAVKVEAGQGVDTAHTLGGGGRSDVPLLV